MTRSPALVALLSLLVAGCVTVVDPTPSPLPEATSVAVGPTPTPVPSARTYVVVSGDNLNAIAQQFGLTVGQLLAANPDITDPNRIRVGQTLIIPPPDAPDTGPDSAGIGDASDDVMDLEGQLLASQSYADLTGFGAALATNRRLIIELEMVNGPPARLDPAVEVITYTVVIDVDGDGQPDFRLIYSNEVEGLTGFHPSLENRLTGTVRSGDTFPGTVTVRDSTITFTVRRAALGTPRAYALAATVERTYYPGGRGDPEVDNSVDHAPDQQWPRPNPRWVEVGGV